MLARREFSECRLVSYKEILSDPIRTQELLSRLRFGPVKLINTNSELIGKQSVPCVCYDTANRGCLILDLFLAKYGPYDPATATPMKTLLKNRLRVL